MSNEIALAQHVTIEWIVEALFEALLEQMSQQAKIRDEQVCEDECKATTNEELNEETISGKHFPEQLHDTFTRVETSVMTLQEINLNEINLTYEMRFSKQTIFYEIGSSA